MKEDLQVGIKTLVQSGVTLIIEKSHHQHAEERYTHCISVEDQVDLQMIFHRRVNASRTALFYFFLQPFRILHALLYFLSQ
jgi:hypothetical protein